MEEAMIVACPKCGGELKIDASMIGVNARCPHCNTGILIEHNDEAEKNQKQSPEPLETPHKTELSQQPLNHSTSSEKQEQLKQSSESIREDASESIQQEETSFEFICPECNTVQVIDKNMVGKKIDCEGCCEEVEIFIPETKPCPHCGEKIKIKAKVCKHCKKNTDKSVTPVSTGQDEKQCSNSLPASNCVSNYPESMCSAENELSSGTKENMQDENMDAGNSKIDYATVYEVGRNQKIILWLFLSAIIAFIFPPLIFVVQLVFVFFIYKLFRLMNRKHVVFWCVLICIPGIGYFVLFWLNGEIISFLRKHGLNVGFMGVGKEQLNSFKVFYEKKRKAQLEKKQAQIEKKQASIAKFEDLVAMKDKGEISEEEFIERKKEILGF